MPSRVSSNWATAGDTRRLQGQQSASRSDGRDHIVGGRRTQDPHRSGSRLLNAFQQCIGSAFGDPISILDHNDLPPSQSRAHGRPADKLAHLVDADRQQLSTHQRDVRVRTGQRRTTLGALPAASRAALQRRRESPTPHSSGRNREDPSTTRRDSWHAARPPRHAARSRQPPSARSAPPRHQGRDPTSVRRPPNERCSHVDHSATRDRRHRSRAGESSGATRAATWAAISSRDARASSTR